MLLTDYYVLSVALFVGILSGFVAMLRAASARVVFTDVGVQIHNVLRNKFVPWTAVAGFRMFTSDRLGAPTIGVLELVDGEEIQMFGIQGPIRRYSLVSSNPEAMIEEMNSAMLKRLAAPSTTRSARIAVHSGDRTLMKYSLRGQQIRALMLGIAFLLFMVVSFAADAAEPGASSGEVVLALLLIFAYVAFLARCYSVGVITSKDTVTIRNVLRTRRIPWSSVQAFRFGNPKSLIRGTGVVELKDGQFVRIVSLWPASQGKKSPGMIETRRIIDQLNEELASYSDGSQTAAV